MPIDVAVKKAVDDCIKEDILKEFLLKNKSEMIQVSIFEYDEEKHKKFLREEGFEDGLERGRAEAIIELLEEMGDVSDALREAILSEKDISVLKKWNKLVAKADSIEDFLKVINYNN